jgi:hypothetical protein
MAARGTQEDGKAGSRRGDRGRHRRARRRVRAAPARLRGRALRARRRAGRGWRRPPARPERGEGAARARHRARPAGARLHAVPNDLARLGHRRRAFPRAVQRRDRGAIRRAVSDRAPRRPASAAARAPARPMHPCRHDLHRRHAGGRRRGRAFHRRRRGRSRCRGRRRRHPIGGAREAVRRAAGALHAADRVALHRADRMRADAGRAARCTSAATSTSAGSGRPDT